LNVTSQESVEEAYEFVRKQIPEGEGIMALVNNAGIARIGADEWLTMEDYDAVWQVNTLGLIRTTKKFLGLVKMAK
jgi:NAD(P)-dependent dehydrogenase (short-subunit alcohol dehydrogenase family)